MSILVAYQICAYATNEIKGSTKGFFSITSYPYSSRCLVFVRLSVSGPLFILKKDSIFIKTLELLVKKKSIFTHFNKSIISIKDISKIESHHLLLLWLFGCLLSRGTPCGVRT